MIRRAMVAALLLASPAGASVDFATHRFFPVGQEPVAMAVADLDEDGRSDCVILNAGPPAGPADTTLLFGDPATGFRAVPGPGGWTGAVALTTADFDGDGHADIAVAAGGATLVRRGLGTGEFAPETIVPGPATPTSLHSADVDSDGRVDLVVLFVSGGISFVDVHLGSGDGRFAETAVRTVLSGLAGAVALADFDEDGSLDVAATIGAADRVDLLRGDGAGLFVDTGTLSCPREPRAIAVADWSGDGHADLVVGNSISRDARLFAGDGGGGFAETLVVPVAFSILECRVEDIDADGLLELVFRTDFDLLLFAPNGGGEYAPLPSPRSGFRASTVAFVKSGADAWPDLVTTQVMTKCPGRAAVQRGVGAGLFADYTSASLFGTISIGADLNGDAIPDPLAGYHLGSWIDLRASDGAGGFGPSVRLTMRLNGRLDHIAAADMNNDGVTDIIATASGGTAGRTAIRYGLGGLTYTASTLVANEGGSRIETGDFDEDGALDFIVADPIRRLAVVLLAGAGASYAVRSRFDVGEEPSGIAVTDVDGDGHLDAAVSSFASDPDVRVFRGDGTGLFEWASSLDTPVHSSGVVAADFDGDSFVDFASCGYERRQDACVSDVWVFFGSGDFRFDSERRRDAGNSIGQLGVGDVDADGFDDLLVVGTQLGMTVFSGDPSRSLRRSAHFAAGGRPVAGDLNRDGLLDVLMIAAGAGSLINRTNALPEVVARRGNVDARSGAAADVLFVNGSPGAGPSRRMHLRADEPVRVDMAAPPAPGTGPAPFVLFGWPSLPDRGTVFALPGGTGSLAFDPRGAAFIWNNTGFRAPGRPSTAAPSVVLSRPRGLGRAGDAYLQGVIADPNSPSGRFAVTNGIELRVW